MDYISQMEDKFYKFLYANHNWLASVAINLFVDKQIFYSSYDLSQLLSSLYLKRIYYKWKPHYHKTKVFSNNFEFYKTIICHKNRHKILYGDNTYILKDKKG